MNMVYIEVWNLTFLDHLEVSRHQWIKFSTTLRRIFEYKFKKYGFYFMNWIIFLYYGLSKKHKKMLKCSNSASVTEERCLISFG